MRHTESVEQGLQESMSTYRGMLVSLQREWGKSSISENATSLQIEAAQQQRLHVEEEHDRVLAMLQRATSLHVDYLARRRGRHLRFGMR